MTDQSGGPSPTPRGGDTPAGTTLRKSPLPTVLEFVLLTRSAPSDARCHWCRLGGPDRYAVISYGAHEFVDDDGEPRRWYWHGRCAPEWAGGPDSLPYLA